MATALAAAANRAVKVSADGDIGDAIELASDVTGLGDMAAVVGDSGDDGITSMVGDCTRIATDT